MSVSARDITPRQRALVRRSFRVIAANHPEMARLYYDRLFQLAPHYRVMFKAERAQMHRKFMRMLAYMVASLDDRSTLQSTMHALGKRHVDYGVRTEQYDVFGQAFMWSLEKILGPQCTPPTREAWRVTYTLLAEMAMNGHAG